MQGPSSQEAPTNVSGIILHPRAEWLATYLAAAAWTSVSRPFRVGWLLRDPDQKPQCLVDRSGIRKRLGDVGSQINRGSLGNLTPWTTSHDAQGSEIVFRPQLVVRCSAGFPGHGYFAPSESLLAR